MYIFYIEYILLTALRDQIGDYILNGPWSLSPSGFYEVAGTTLLYERGDENQVEYIQARGPLNESLHLEASRPIFYFSNFQ